MRSLLALTLPSGETIEFRSGVDEPTLTLASNLDCNGNEVEDWTIVQLQVNNYQMYELAMAMLKELRVRDPRGAR